MTTLAQALHLYVAARREFYARLDRQQPWGRWDTIDQFVKSGRP